jgi:hypothetical protein
MVTRGMLASCGCSQASIPPHKEIYMKLFAPLFCALFLLMSATVVAADDAGVPAVESAVAQSAVTVDEVSVPETLDTAEEANSAVEKDCEPTDNGLFQNEWIQPTAAPNSCGSCSSSNCKGAIRGQACWTGSGWGYCNIYSGGFRCPTGGWECDCGVGPLP